MPASRPIFLQSALLVYLVIAKCSFAAAALHKMTAGARCDVVSATVADTTSCLDISRLDGTTLRVPSATTRISTQGLVVCGKAEQTTDPMDIVYIVDQSGSMTPQSILPLGRDTMAYYNCTAPSLYGSIVPTATYHGQAVLVIAAADSAYARANCASAGDPTSIRAQLVQDGIQQQAKLSPGSQVAWISFSGFYTATAMVNLSDTAARSGLINTITNFSMTSTNYEDPLGWARILLQGGTSFSGTTTPASPNRRKAIIMISDGEPNDTGYLKAIYPNDSIRSPQRQPWRTPSPASPPIYGFLLTNENRPGQALQTLAQMTGGKFTQIPPAQPDSLRRTLSRILGSLLATGRPDSLRITNTTNGQVSVGITSGHEAGGYRVRLDSIVGLRPGKNLLQLRFVLTGVKDSIVTANWTIEVADSASSFSAQGTDSSLMAACYGASKLRLRPQKDSARLFADGRDTLINFSLSTRNENQLVMPTIFSTQASRDSGIKMLRWVNAPPIGFASTSGATPWWLASANRTDSLIQTGTGWDTLRAIFRMPRDPRDSAIASLPLLHPWLPAVGFSSDTITGVAASLGVWVRDGNVTADSLFAKIIHRLGDTVILVLHRDTGAVFRSHVSFVQGANLVRSDTLLQTGGFRGSSPDTLVAIYAGSYRDTAQLQLPRPRLRFIDPAGNPQDSTVGASLDLGESTSFRIGLFLQDKLLAQNDSVQILPPSWLTVASGATGPSILGLRLSGGTATIWIRGLATGTNGRIPMNLVGWIDSLVFAPIKVASYRLRFVQPDGSVTDTLSVDRDVKTSALVQVQVWGKTGWCAACSGPLRLVSSDPHLVVTDSAAKSTSVAIKSGSAWVRIRSDVYVGDASLVFWFDSLAASVTVTPIRFRAPPPDSAEYFDANGDGALDRIRVHFKTPWSPAASLSFPWADSAQILDLSQAVAIPTSDSLTVDFDFARPQRHGTTGWTNTRAPSAFWSAASGQVLRHFPIFERIAPIPLQARIARGAFWDTLCVTASELLDTSTLGLGQELVRKLVAPFGLLTTTHVAWDRASNELRLAYPSNSIDSLVIPGDSVRFAPNAGTHDRNRNAPGWIAPAVVVKGIDRPPFLALIEDADADGRADRVVLHFATPPRVTDRFEFGWSNRQGGIDRRSANSADAATDSGGRILTFWLTPFDYGATACPTVGCQALGQMHTSRWGGFSTGFDEMDAVPAVILAGQLRFGRTLDVPDTLRATLSEPVTAEVAKEWLRWGRPSHDSLGFAIGRIRQDQVNLEQLVLLLDSSFQGKTGDSLRLAARPKGGVVDFAAVGSLKYANWAPLHIGPVPPRFSLLPWPATVRYLGWPVPPQEPAMNVFIRASEADPWIGLDGKSPLQDSSHYAGILIRANREIRVAAVYLYDNLGVSVGRFDLAPLAQALAQGRVKTTLRGDYQAWVVWNGRAKGGAMVSSGVYPVRVLAWRQESGKPIALNAIYKLGWKVGAP